MDNGEYQNTLTYQINNDPNPEYPITRDEQYLSRIDSEMNCIHNVIDSQENILFPSQIVIAQEREEQIWGVQPQFHPQAKL